MGHPQGGAGSRATGYGDHYTELPGMGIHALGPNAVVVLSEAVWSAEAAAALKDAMREDVIVVGVPDLDAIKVLDEDAMREAGWVRA